MTRAEVDAYGEGIAAGHLWWNEQIEPVNPYPKDTAEHIAFDEGGHDGWGDAYHNWMEQA